MGSHELLVAVQYSFGSSPQTLRSASPNNESPHSGVHKGTAMDKQIFGEQIASRLAKAEESLDAALGDMTGLLSYMSKQRIDAGLALSYGHDVIEGAMKASAMLMEGRGVLIHVHERLAVYQRHQRVVLGGSGLDKPSSALADGSAERLRVVKTA